MNSFTGNTKVLLPGSKTIAVAKVKAGQKVLATDPYTGKTAAQRGRPGHPPPRRARHGPDCPARRRADPRHRPPPHLRRLNQDLHLRRRPAPRQPVSSASSVAVGCGYDLGGHQTAYTDGNGRSTYQTFNSLGLAESVIEPPAGANTGAGASTSTTVYDAARNVVTQDLPGGVAVSDSYDVMGNLTGQTGTGAAAVTAARTFGYDANGRVTSAVTAAAGTQGSAGYQPATSESFTYNDRGRVLTPSGSAGASSFGYNADGQITSRADASGNLSVHV